MNFNKLKKIYFALMYLPILITIVSLFFLPDTIPTHYGDENKVTDWGSKYTTLLFPIFTIFMGYFILIPSWIKSKNFKEYTDKEKYNLKTSIYIGYTTLIIFNILTYFFLYAAFYKLENLSEFPFFKAICIGLAILFIVIILLSIARRKDNK